MKLVKKIAVLLLAFGGMCPVMAQTEGVSQDVVKIASDIMAFEEDNINKMKNYL